MDKFKALVNDYNEKNDIKDTLWFLNDDAKPAFESDQHKQNAKLYYDWNIQEIQTKQMNENLAKNSTM